jgi:hypothetical protein
LLSEQVTTLLEVLSVKLVHDSLLNQINHYRRQRLRRSVSGQVTGVPRWNSHSSLIISMGSLSLSS